MRTAARARCDPVGRPGLDPGTLGLIEGIQINQRIRLSPYGQLRSGLASSRYSPESLRPLSSVAT